MSLKINDRSCVAAHRTGLSARRLFSHVVAANGRAHLSRICLLQNRRHPRTARHAAQDGRGRSITGTDPAQRPGDDGATPAVDFTPVAEAMFARRAALSSTWFMDADVATCRGAIPARKCFSMSVRRHGQSELVRRFEETTGQYPAHGRGTGHLHDGLDRFPQACAVSHRNITVQNLCLAYGCDWINIKRMLVNLPPSHVGCQGEELMTTFFTGGTAVILHRFDAEKSLQAIEPTRSSRWGRFHRCFRCSGSYRISPITT